MYIIILSSRFRWKTGADFNPLIFTLGINVVSISLHLVLEVGVGLGNREGLF